MSYSEPLINQPRHLFMSIGVGVLLCFIYVLLQGTGRILGEGRLSYYIADGIFCGIFALVSFFFMVIYCGGRVRLHLILGEAAGFFLFYFSVGKYIYEALKSCSNILQRMLVTFFKPYVFIFSSFKNGFKDLVKRISAENSRHSEKEGNSYEKKKKKFNLFDKIHLQNPDKSV